MSEKSGTRPPHEGELAVVLRGCTVDGVGWSSLPGSCMVGTAKTLGQVACDIICVVENWEALREIHKYQWIDSGSARLLYVFRGDNKFSPTHVQSFLATRKEPLWAFVDFDPAGLGIANGMSNERMLKVLLPPSEWLVEAAANPEGRRLFARQEAQWRAVLDSSTNQHVQTAWRLLKQVRAGVTQERMQAAVA